MFIEHLFQLPGQLWSLVCFHNFEAHLHQQIHSLSPLETLAASLLSVFLLTLDFLPNEVEPGQLGRSPGRHDVGQGAGGDDAAGMRGSAALSLLGVGGDDVGGPGVRDDAVRVVKVARPVATAWEETKGLRSSSTFRTTLCVVSVSTSNANYLLRGPNETGRLRETRTCSEADNYLSMG